MYVYRHRRLDTNKIFYVGIGSRKDRASSKRGRNNLWNKIINKTDYIVEIIAENLESEEAKELENFLVTLYGRIDLKTGTLSNLTDGGDFRDNYTVSDETKLKISKAHKGRIQSKEWVEKRTSHFKGIPLTEETKLKLSETMKGRIPSEETRLKLSTSQKNRVYTEIELQNIKERMIKLHGKKIINTITGEIFNSISEAAHSIGMKRYTLNAKLLGKIKKNETNLKFLENE